MPKVFATLEGPEPKPEARSLALFFLMLRRIYSYLATIVNGQISFGDGVNRDNIDGNWVSTVTPVAPNTDFTLTHNLGRIPVGFLLMSSDRAVSIYNGTVPWTVTTITLKASVASAAVSLFIF